MSTSEQLEREVEKCRAQISDSLEELRARMTPGEVVDQLVDYARDSTGGMFFRNLQRQVVGNPFPAAMIGVGLAWLAVGSRRPDSRSASDIGAGWGEAAGRAGEAMQEQFASASGTARQASESAAERARSTASDLADKARETTEDWTEQARGTAAAASDRARSTADAGMASTAEAAAAAAGSLRNAAASGYQAGVASADRAASAIRDSAASLRESATSARESIGGFFQEQPLVLVGLGIALGAALGAVLPETRAEDRLMGEASDELKQRASDVAGEQYEKAKTVAEHAYSEAKQDAEKEGLGSNLAAEHTHESAGSSPTLVPSCDTAEVREAEHGGAEKFSGDR
jgi:Protein of unknown function (DUF3618)